MIATTKIPPNPWEQTPASPGQDLQDVPANPWDAPAATPTPQTGNAVQPPQATQTATPVTSPTTPGSSAGAAPASPVGAISQLPDGAGGVVPVPPVAMAPPSVVPPAAPPPWLSAQEQMTKMLQTPGTPDNTLPTSTPGDGSTESVLRERAGNVSATAALGPRPVATADNWQNADALGKAWDDQQNARGAAQILAEMQHPAPAGETWDQSNIRNGLSINPATGAWDRADERAPGNTGPTVYGGGGTNGPLTQSLNGGPTTALGGAPLPAPAPSDVTPWTPATPALQPTPAAPAAPWEPAAPATQPFSADANLVGTQINPTTGKRTVDLQNAQDTALGKITSGPDRLALAKQYMDAFRTGTEADYQHRQKDATNMAAEHGYLGSGRLTNQYGDLENTREQQLKAKELGYLTDAATGTIADNQTAYADTASAAGTSAEQDRQHHADLRGERGYQAQQAAQAVADRQAQQAAEQQAQQQSFSQALQTYLAGQQNNPTGAYETAAGQASSEAGGQSQDVAALMKLIASMGGG